jgi:hypothetical protein
MERTRIWNKDNVNFEVGCLVLVFRRKKNGHPKTLTDGVGYFVRQINGEDLVLSDTNRLIKVHRSYMIPIEVIRGSLIDELLK